MRNTTAATWNNLSGRGSFLTETALPTHLPLAGQVAVITGAGRGIGRAIALKLAELGARTVLCGRSRRALQETSAVIQKSGGLESSVLECDVTDLHSVEAMGREVESKFHRLDILVNNAGIGGMGNPLHELAPENWERVMNTNLRGVYYCI